MHLVIYEGNDFASLAPLTFFRPTFCLRSGASSLLDKQIRFYGPERLSLWVRDELVEYCRRFVLPRLPAALREATTINRPLDDAPARLCDGRAFVISAIDFDRNDADIFPAAGLTPSDAARGSDRFLEALHRQKIDPPQRIARRIWDLLAWNEESLISDLRHLQTGLPSPTQGPFHLINDRDVLIGDGVKLQPGCVIDASGGPVYLGDGVIIGSNAVVFGPCAIGEHSEIAPLATIRPRTSIGPRCKLGGEVSASIVQGYSNKAHDGFLGDSYLGEWVNFGAGTTTSNLKNTYGNVSMHADKKQIDTGRQFLGSIVGDHSKTGIGTRLMTGTYIGGCSMVATSSSPPRFVPSFRFCTDEKTETYRLEKAVDVARTAYGRRKRILDADDEAIIKAAAMWAAANE